MRIYYLLLILFTILAVISSDKRIIQSNSKIISITYTAITISLIMLIGLRSVGVGVDDFNYLNSFNQSKFGYYRKDISFYILSNIFPSIHFIFFSFAFLSISLKARFFLTKTKYFGLIFLLYFSSFLFLHDFVQIRAAVVSGMLLWILYFAGEKRILVSAILIGIAISFHLSAVSFIPLIFLKNTNKKLIFLIFAIISLLIAFLYPINIDSLAQILPEFIYNRIKIFLLADDYEANLFNPIAIIHYIFALIIFTNWEKLANFSNHSVFVIKTFLISLYFFLIFHNTGIGFRLYELLVIVQLPLIDIFLRALKRKYLIIGLVILLSFAYFYYYVIKYPVVNSYSFFFL